MTEDNKTFSFYLSKGTICCIVCNVLVNHVFACFVFICYLCNVGFKGSSEFMLYVATCPELNKTFGLVKCGKEISRDLWKKLNNSGFSAFQHTPC